MSRIAAQPEIFPVCDQARQRFLAAYHTVRHTRGMIGSTIATSWQELSGNRSVPLLLISMLRTVDDSFMTQVDSVRSRPRAFLLISDRDPCQAFVEHLLKLRVRDPERIHVACAETESAQEELFERFLVTLSAEDQFERIFDAWWDGDVLAVLSPRFERLHVPVKKLSPLKGQSREILHDFKIDEDGAYIYWPSLDVHLGWEQFAQVVDPKAYLRARQQSQDFNRRYGSGIRQLRKKHGLRQSDIAGLTARQVGRIERGRCRATHSALTKLAVAHGMEAPSYLKRLAELVQ